MNIIEKNARVMMATAQLAMTPNYCFPDCYRMRWYQSGDVETWVRVLSASERYDTITRDLCIEFFGADEAMLAQRVGFLVNPAGQEIGTATAWVDSKWQARIVGRVNFVAIVPVWQGKGLAKPMMSAVCQRLLQQGQTEAYLYTSSARVPAINLYRSFGFDPVITNEEDRQIWCDLAPCLKMPIAGLHQCFGHRDVFS
jgi:predicted GNAT family acetyltransferase